MILTCGHVNKLALRLKVPSLDARNARAELEEIVKATPSMNAEADAIRMAQKVLDGTYNVVAANQPYMGRTGHHNRGRR